MTRPRRFAPAGVLQHVCNRGSRRGILFDQEEDYIAFIRLLDEARSLYAMRILAYCLMPNHWHLLLWPDQEHQLSRFMKWLSGTHARQWRRDTGTVGQGAVYQSRFTAVAIEDSWHLLIVWRYIERNPIVSKLSDRAEDWPWSSAAQPPHDRHRLSLDTPPHPLPPTWLDAVQDDLEWPLMFEVSNPTTGV